MNKYKVYGRVRVDYCFEHIVEASSEEAAVRKAEKINDDHLDITSGDSEHLDDEIYCEKIGKGTCRAKVDE